MIDFEDCLKAGFLRKIPPSPAQAKEQLEKAKVLLEEAKTLVNKAPNAAVLTGYAAALDAARAILFNDGYREKSHACVARYLEAKYSKEIGKNMIMMLDEYRNKRHKTQYASDYYPTVQEAKRIVAFADEFISRIEELI
ncbi:HEPN domain-containing protein [Candidatus Micrarchaeota archaeon]|nr:HEPN domain-containing protein [Candidatus Micrarchaeota archaeon]